MGQTLTHGVYLPDEGERNCYAGLAANWQILDTSVGTIAEHTSALSVKAPLVHTHTKSDITDFPAYGNTAGTICEGNDSRLSDARTPVAHIHTKSDVTDLLNSDFIPSANNSYNLGSSSYQWNNLYAKNYYYNGVAWGLDKANTWSASQTLAANAVLTVRGYRFRIKNDSMILGTVPSNNLWTGFSFTDKNDNLISEIIQSFQKNGNSLYQINVFPNEANAEKRSIIAWTYNSANSVNHASFSSNVIPQNTNTYELGTSNNKWKTLNGINPGALSLPDYDRFEPIDFSQWDVNLGFNNTYIPSEDGWLYLNMKDAITNSVFVYASGLSNVNGYNRQYSTCAYGNGTQGTGRLSIFLPVRKNIQYRFLIKASAVSDIFSVFFMPCCGNV